MEQGNKLNFLLMRHGESKENSKGCVPLSNGCIGLTDNGKQQAKDAAIFISNLTEVPDVILASPIRRAYETAQIVSEYLNCPLIESALFAEQNLGDWEGLPWDQVMPLLNDKVAPPNGEDYPDFNNRIGSVISFLNEKGYCKPLIVSHGGMWYGIASLYGAPPLLLPKNTEIRNISLQDNPRSMDYSIIHTV